MDMAVERAILGKVTRRLIPFLFLLFIFNFLDRTNVSLAALTMKPDLRFSDAVYGLGVGIFWLGYCLFEVPSNLILQRMGARLWIARIMLTWGIISSAMLFVRSPGGFYTLRFLLGVAEAGFAPGIIFYLTQWYPAAERAKAVSRFLTAIPLSGVLGGPLSGALLTLNGVAGLKGWQWVFLAEGLPSVLLGLVTLVYLTDRPAVAEWLSLEERRWLTERIQREQEQRDRHHAFTLAQAFARPSVLLLCVVYFTSALGYIGMLSWAPLILKSRSSWSAPAISGVMAIPGVLAALGMVAAATHSDRHGERRRHLAGAYWMAALGLVASALVHSPVLTLAAFAAVSLGLMSALGPFWALATSQMSSAAAAGAIAFINSFGALGGFVGPALMGALKESTGSYTVGLCMLAGSVLVAGLLALRVRHDPALDRPVAALEAKPLGAPVPAAEVQG
jgi:MFS transporter, ACS family, tartrate transporter